VPLEVVIGTEQLNELLSVMDVPTVTYRLMKRAEEVMGPLVVEVARESCVDAIAEEKRLTLNAQRLVFSHSYFGHPRVHFNHFLTK